VRNLFEDCVLEGMNDDAFNVSTHGWRVVEMTAPDRIRVRQIFPLQAMPLQVGGNLLVLTKDATRRLEPAGITGSRELPRPGVAPAAAPDLELTLDRALAGL
jgi:hypothetical protein